MEIFKGKSELLINRRRQDLLDMIDVVENTTLDHDKHSRIIEREGRRRRRGLRMQCEAKSQYEGLSSDDELLPSTEAKIQSDIGILFMCQFIFWTVLQL